MQISLEKVTEIKATNYTYIPIFFLLVQNKVRGIYGHWTIIIQLYLQYFI